MNVKIRPTMPKANELPEAEIPGTDPSLGNFKEIIAHRHLNLELLSSRTVRQQMSVVSAIGFVILCNGGPRKLTQCLISRSTWTW